MSVNFYKESVQELGFDPHTWWTFPAVEQKTIHIVPIMSFGSELADPDQKTSTVTADGTVMLKGGATRLHAVHIPIPRGIPSPLEAVEIVEGERIPDDLRALAR